MCGHCWSCVSPGHGTECRSCSLVIYCSPACREEASQEHRQECTVLGTAGLHLSDQLRLVMKIWLKVRRREEADLVERGEKTSKTWAGLISHSDQLLQDSRDLLEAQYGCLQAHIKQADLPSMEEFVTIYGKILTNSFSLRSDR